MMPIELPFSGAVPLVLFLAKATLLLVVALVATIPLRSSTAGARHLLWLAALVGVLALPLLSRIQSLHIGLLPSRLAPAAPALSPPPALASTPPAAPPIMAAPALAPAFIGRPPAAAPAGMPAPAIAADVPVATPVPSAVAAGVSPAAILVVAPTVLTAIAIAWASVALALVGWLVAGAFSVRRIVRNARELTSPDWAMPLCEVADRLDLEVPPRLVMSDRIEMAFACRALAPTIVLPASAESWTDDRRRAVLFHELAHVKRHDLVSHLLGRLACALYWFHPLVWTAAKHLRAESERACDDLVLSCGARPSEYAQHLLEMVTSVRDHGAPIMGLPMARKKEFEGRMLAILDPAIRRASPGRLQAAAVIVTISVVSLSVAAIAPASATQVTDAAVARSRASSPPPSSERAPHAAPMIDAAPPAAMPLPGAGAVATTPRAVPPQAPTNASQIQAKSDTGRIGMLIRILSTDADAVVRRTAAWGLNDLHSPDARAALIKALHVDQDWSVREMAAWSLADDHADEVATALSDALHDKNPRVRATAVWGLGDMDARGQISELESAISDSDSQVREVAIWAIGQFGIHSAPRPIVNALTDNSQPVRLVAAWALGEFADSSTAPAIVSAFKTEPNTEVRTAEMRALSEIGYHSQAVLDMALASSDPEMRRHAVAMLAGGNSGFGPWPWPRPQPRPSP